MLQCRNLSYSYPGTDEAVLRDVNLDIRSGEFVLVAGVSGAGKSTLLRCFNGLVPHFTGGNIGGEIRIDGHSPIVQGPQVLSTRVGFVFQDPENQFVLDTVEDEIAFALENRAVPSEEMHRRVSAIMALLHLTPLRQRSLDTLSGGQRQRVAIAAALALQPQLLVLDEPTSQLDPESAEEVLSSLLQVNRELGLTVILAEHRLERVLPFIDRIVYLPGKGQPPCSGNPRDILRQMDIIPPVIALGKALGWEPLPLSVEEALPWAHRTRERAQKLEGRRGAQSSTRESLLRVEGVSYRYGDLQALDRVDIRLSAGELVALMGPNGSGKTTLSKCVIGLLKPQSGSIWLRGQRNGERDTATLCRDIGYLPQQPDDLLFAESVLGELQVTLGNHGLLAHPPLEPLQLLADLGIGELAGAYPRDLSVGQRQRVALGAITVTRPHILVLDEPTRGMDYWAKRDLVRLLHHWQAEGCGVLLVTHDVELVAQAADRVVLLERGRVVADGAPATELRAWPHYTPQVARMFPDTDWLTVEDVLQGSAH